MNAVSRFVHVIAWLSVCEDGVRGNVVREVSAKSAVFGAMSDSVLSAGRDTFTRYSNRRCTSVRVFDIVVVA